MLVFVPQISLRKGPFTNLYVFFFTFCQVKKIYSRFREKMIELNLKLFHISHEMFSRLSFSYFLGLCQNFLILSSDTNWIKHHLLQNKGLFASKNWNTSSRVVYLWFQRNARSLIFIYIFHQLLMMLGEYQQITFLALTLLQMLPINKYQAPFDVSTRQKEMPTKSFPIRIFTDKNLCRFVLIL